MLRLIYIDNNREGYVDPLGQCYELDGALITAGISYVTLDHNPPQPGWYTPPPSPPPAPPPTRHITKLAFRNRFTMAEKTAVELAAVHDPNAATSAQQLAASLRAMLADQRDATYIDLDRADTRNGVLQLETYGILAPGRALEILDNPVEPHEVFRD